MSVQIYIGDMLDVLDRLPADSFDAAATDPPYHLTSIVERFGGEDAAPAQEGFNGVYRRKSRGFMGQEWDGGDIAFRPETWAKVYRVLKPGAYLVAFSGTRTYHNMVTAIAAAGFEVRDMIAEIVAADTHVERFLASLTVEQQRAFALCVDESTFGGLLNWIFGSGFPHSKDAERAVAKRLCALPGRHYEKRLPGKAKRRPGDHICPVIAASEPWKGYGTALKPGQEPICLARKPIVGGSVAANLLAHGVGALNIDAGRIEGTKPQVIQGVNGNPSSYAPAQNRQLSGDPDEGRWPANVILGDASGEVGDIFPRTGSGSVPKRRGAGGIGTSGHEGMMPEAPGRTDAGTADRYFYTAKADTAERHEGCRDLETGNPHPTVKPIDLMEHLVSLITPAGGRVLDPFLGSGSTAIAALHAQVDCVGIELSADYAHVAERRIRHHVGLFADVEVIPAPLPENDADQPSAATGA